MADLTQDEKDRLFLTLDAHTETLKGQNATAAKQSEKLQLLEQGMFGNKQLRQPGLISDVEDVKKWIAKMSLNIAYISGGISLAVIAGKAIWDWATKK